jgi:hypothetical protein
MYRRSDAVLVGITGRKFSGKDTVGGYLHAEYYAHLDSFAGPLKEGLAVMFSAPRGIFDDPILKELPDPGLLGKTPRHLMQTLGTEWGRTHVQHDVWAELLSRRVASVLGNGRRYVAVTDVRYDDEAERIHALGGQVWQVNRDLPGTGCGDGHSSEAGVSSHLIDHTLDNNGSLDHLYAQINAILR